MFIFSDPLPHGSVRTAVRTAARTAARREAPAGIGGVVRDGVDEWRAESYCLA